MHAPQLISPSYQAIAIEEYMYSEPLGPTGLFCCDMPTSQGDQR